ncbi:hypothetical protein SAMN05660642_03042 [Geodermatophilus siccatus]|uniref:Uncharacterized protein n=1 Tax=Geodermatophilus siccatus TaxID=1137991 RepID=A0A1G9V1I5_9ACTN|nr:hypothetical protein [Geodermatophilus siccatus]SDM65940.1 hypothetical protein SAMN05660642_03042 [Geodermatophilus siccatus]
MAILIAEIAQVGYTTVSHRVVLPTSSYVYATTFVSILSPQEKAPHWMVDAYIFAYNGANFIAPFTSAWEHANVTDVAFALAGTALEFSQSVCMVEY